ncbi:MAG: hypothetical protein KGJ80_05125 [Chloroflexota bacterium]|nr:hypothetical protein [Chloroflexota bacterium]
MAFKLPSPPTTEEHAENLIHLFLRDANGVAVPNARVKVWAGQPPAGSPTYWNDDFPFRQTSASGMLEFIAVTGPMPEDRDYWMQVLDNSGAAQSAPVQFHFPRGGTIWITATLVQEGSPTPIGSPIGSPLTVNLDPRLAAMHVTVQPVTVAAGQPYWKIIDAKYQDETEAGGNHNIYYTALDENGVPAPGIPIQMDWQGREPNDIPTQVFTDGNGAANSAMYHGPVGWRPDDGPGPYIAWVGDPDLRGRNATGVPGEKLVGAGLPMNRHVNFIVTWRQVRVGSPPSATTLEQAAVASAQKYTWMPINTDGALYKFAVANHLGYPQTDEFELTFGGDVYVGQVYNLGIVYVKKGDWGNVMWVKKP